MGFCGYRYRFGLYAAHSNIISSEQDAHFHNFSITLYIHSNSKHDDNFNVERAVQEWFKPFQGQKLARMELFSGRETTVEGMGNAFFDPLYDLIDKLGYTLIRLDIYENPIRVYSVSNKRLDSKVNEINSFPLECIPEIRLDDEDPVTVNHEIIVEDKNDIVYIPEDSSDPQNDLTSQESTVITENSVEIVHIKKKTYIVLDVLIGLACFIALSVITMYLVKISGRYPQGSDTFCHLYRADLILKSIKQGNWYPLYDPTWYNGVEIMRYWGPIPLYIIAGLEWISQSGVLDAYLLFLGVLVVIGGCGWLLWGVTYHRVPLSIVLGLIWFYIPENMRVVIYEGNLPRGVINSLLPFFFYFFWKVLAERKKNAIWPLLLVTMLITMCHLGITIMLIATVSIFTVIYSRMNHSLKNSIYALGTSVAGVLSAGVWVVPALIGGAASGSSTNQVMKNFFESAAVSLNPFNRLNGDLLSFYFGFAIFIICIFGIIFGSKAVKPGFITAIILFLCTTKSIYELFVKLPFSQFLWMIRFIPIGLAAALVSFIMWKQLRKWMVLLFCILLLADSITSIQYIYFPKDERIQDVQAKLDERAEDMLLTEAKEVTNQRMAVLDLSEYGSFAPYYITGVGKSVNYTFGAGWEGAGTATNIVRLNAAVENGWYVYLFDRALELGNDTVLIPIDNLKEKQKDVDKVIEEAIIRGYNIIENNGNSLLFHKDTTKQFGVITEYKNIAIGSSASAIAMIFPTFEEGTEDNINNYTFEELCNYQTIYLSGITYKDKAKAEELLLRLAEYGVEVYIDMNKIPDDKIKKQMELFGVNSQSIKFAESYPEFTYHGINYTSLDFTNNADMWNTVYLNGLEQVDGYCSMPEKTIPYLGTSKNENLHFIGLNIVYYLQTTRDMEITKLVEAIFGMSTDRVPDRQVVPISVRTGNNTIEIYSEYDNVNTSLSNIDIFKSDDDYKESNNLVIVNTGSTVIHIRYPHLYKGLLVTVFGVILVLLTYFMMSRRKEHEVNAEDEGGKKNHRMS